MERATILILLGLVLTGAFGYAIGNCEGYHSGYTAGYERGTTIEKQHTLVVENFVDAGGSPSDVEKLQKWIDTIHGNVYPHAIWGCNEPFQIFSDHGNATWEWTYCGRE